MDNINQINRFSREMKLTLFTERIIYKGHCLDIPSGFNYIATDKDGIITLFDEKPVMKDDEFWMTSIPFGIFIIGRFDLKLDFNWTESLVNIKDITE